MGTFEPLTPPEIRKTWHVPAHTGQGVFLTLLLTALSLAPGIGLADDSKPLRGRVVFLGDSITYDGKYIEFLEATLRHLGAPYDLEIINVGLPSETVSGLSEPGHAGGAFPRPDLHERLHRVLKQTRPNVVVACYGMNDGIYYPFAEERFLKFQQGVAWLHESVAKTGARIIHLTPPVFDPVPIQDMTLPAGRAEYRLPFSGYNDVLNRYSDWLVGQRAQGWEVVDIHGPINSFLAARREKDPGFRLAGDGVHPDATGHWLMAREFLVYLGMPAQSFSAETPEQMSIDFPQWSELLKPVQQRQRLLKDSWLTLTGHQRPGMATGLPFNDALKAAESLDAQIQSLSAIKNNSALPFPGKRREWNGFPRYDFVAGEKMVTVITPTQSSPGKPWAWKAEFLDAFPATEIALLKQGFHIVYLSVPDMLGSPEAVRQWDACHRELTGRYGMAKRPALIALSRGGLYAYNWAAADPNKVACIYADAAVCDFKSWPGGKGKGKGSPRDWELVLDRYHFKSEAEALAYGLNPVDELAPLAKTGIPLLHVYGDADDLVPWEENTGKLAEAYRRLGGPIMLIPKPGIGHHPHGLADPKPIVDFIVEHASKP